MNPPSHQNRFLLYVEMQLISVGSAAALTYALKRLYPTPSQFPFLQVFGALSGTSAIILSVAVAAAAQKRRKFLPSCRIMFHLPFAIAVLFGASFIFQVQPEGPLALAGKCDSRHYLRFTQQSMSS